MRLAPGAGAGDLQGVHPGGSVGVGHPYDGGVAICMLALHLRGTHPLRAYTA